MMGKPPCIASVPALVVAIRNSDRWPWQPSTAEIVHRQDLAPVYRIGPAPTTAWDVVQSPEAEIQAALGTIHHITDRLRRLPGAYGEWQEFDPYAYFDLFPVQGHCLTRISEGASTVHITFFVDLLLPSFQVAEGYWVHSFRPAYHALRTEIAGRKGAGPLAHDFETESCLQLAVHCHRLLSVVTQIRDALAGDLSFLATLAGEEERYRWRRYWGEPAAGLTDPLLPPLAHLPTLTLSTTFPLPVHRQPGRTRRLRRAWQRRKRHGPPPGVTR